MPFAQLASRLAATRNAAFERYVEAIIGSTAKQHLSAPVIAVVYTTAAEARGVPAPSPSDAVRRAASQLLSVNIHARGYLPTTTHREVVWALWSACANHLLAALAAKQGAGGVKAAWAALSPAGRSQLALDVHFFCSLFDLCHPAEGQGPHRPDEWQSLEQMVGATARAENAPEVAAEDATALWRLMVGSG